MQIEKSQHSRQTDNAGNSVNLISALSVYSRVGISQSALETNNRFYFFPFGFESRLGFGYINPEHCFSDLLFKLRNNITKQHHSFTYVKPKETLAQKLSTTVYASWEVRNYYFDIE